MARLLMLFVTLILCGSPLPGVAQQPQADVSDTDAWKDYYRARAEDDYSFAWSEEEVPLSLRSTAIVNWTNPLEKGQIHGSTFVWENDGRPILVGQFFSYLINENERSYCHVFSTLSDEAVVGRRKGETFWKPTLSEGSGWTTVTDEQAPSDNRARRLLQMRRMARQFTAFTEEASRGKRDLRLLPQPLYRSDEGVKGFDCGLFAYVVGTDPELLILIESDLTAEAPRWRYRFVQSTQSTTVAARNGSEVYRYEKKGKNPGSMGAIYYSRHGVETIPANLAN